MKNDPFTGSTGLRFLKESTSVVAVLVNPQGMILAANQYATKLIGEPLVEQPWHVMLLNFTGNLVLDDWLANPIRPRLLNVRTITGLPQTLEVTVEAEDENFFLFGEINATEQARLAREFLELNHELDNLTRELALKNDDLARSSRKLQESEARLIIMSLTDPLTGLANRRRLMEFLENEIDRNQRFQEPFSILMTDIDFFKKVNDGFGHDVGDEVLLAFAKLMQNSTRSIDLVARLGGEEFIIVMPNTPLEGAMEKAELLRAETEQLYFDSMQRGITASFGVAEFQSTDDANILLKQVDKAVYASKDGGRNRVTSYPAAIEETTTK